MNIGIATGNGLIVVDVDVKNNAAGEESLKQLIEENGDLPKTWTANTPSGGKHYYFSYEGEIKCKTGVRPGLDIRADGGYVVAPPSAADGTYEWANAPWDTELAAIPEWLEDIVKERVHQITSVLCDDASDIPKGSRNSTLFKIAVGYAEKGRPLDEITAMLEKINKTRCMPPLPEREVKAIAASASKYDPFADLIEESGTHDLMKEMGFYTYGSLTEAEKEPPEFIVEGLIPIGLTFISGAPKTRKSFLALQMAMAVAEGQKFLGMDTKKCEVAYFDLEGSKSRTASRCAAMGVELPDTVHMTHDCKGKIADSLVHNIERIHKELPMIRLFIIDTYSRARGAISANGSNAYDQDVQILEPVQKLAQREKIAIVFIHHDKKGAAMVQDTFERLSGTMGISGSADCVINLILRGKRSDMKATLEYSPRDAVCGELGLYFNMAAAEWCVDQEESIASNPVAMFVIDHKPKKGIDGKFYSYKTVADACDGDFTTDDIRKVLGETKNELYEDYGIGIQLGVKKDDARGIRIYA